MKNVSLFIPCLVDTLLPATGESMVSLLRRLGCSPSYHPEQTCCGLIPYNSGYRKEAARLARRFVALFEKDEAVVCPSGSCVAMVRNAYGELLCDEPDWQARAEAVSRRVYELSEFIVDVLAVEDVGASYGGKVAYHESCSLVNGLGVTEQPKKLIRAVKGAELVALNAADVCCGFGGKFSHAYPEISEPMVAAKVKNYIDSGADLLLTAEPGCLLNISGYLSRNFPEKKAMHLADFLAGNLNG